MLRRSLAVALLISSLLLPSLAFAQQPAAQTPAATDQGARTQPTPDPNSPIERIKDEGMNHSQVMQTLSYLTDVIGPRLTGSPNLKRANEWTRDKLASWGLQNAHLESWGPFGRGWALKRFSAQVVEPQAIPLIAYPRAWSPSTNGPVTADVVYLDATDEAGLAQYKGKLAGAIVMLTPVREVKAHFEALGTRQSEKDLLALADAPDPRLAPPRPFNQFGTPEQRAAAQLAAAKLRLATDEGAAVIIDPSPRGDGGTIFVQSATVPQPADTPRERRINAYSKDAPKITPQVVVATEQYNRILRMIQAGEKVRMTVDLAAQFYDQDLNAYNTVAEIPGTDLKDEIVMVGGHMDSWHSGTGATDNGAGVSVAMEAVRILRALGIKPRRTIRIALWTGEEQGLLGSRAYVTQHFGKLETQPSTPTQATTPAAPNATGPTPATPRNAPPQGGTAQAAQSGRLITTPEYEKFDAYFNLDNGTGKIRGVYMQGNEAVRAIFRQWLMPFKDWGAETLTISNTGGTDHLSFDAIGLPGFQFIQDEIEYDTRTHHSNQDVFDRIQADDMKQAATIMATFLYNTAMMDDKLPRKPAPGTRESTSRTSSSSSQRQQ